jgi:hypothetical protein
VIPDSSEDTVRAAIEEAIAAYDEMRRPVIWPWVALAVIALLVIWWI